MTSDPAKVGKAAREARDRFSRDFGGFYYKGREKPHVIREYGRAGGEVVFATADWAEYNAEMQRLKDEYVGRAALKAFK